ncbi:MAG: D-glycerate dehydrogenase [Betaproteobacteria bacterium RIFCSPLOWO2_12_FULL_62_13b]|nr:MAG: D-glycerate dehydrogenase [Betaproteobacteria bacterium RIFCSPLOWO2_12_FULL_62_13b]
MKPKVLVTREVFDETLDYLAQHCEVESNQQDVPLDPGTLAQRLKDKEGVACCLTDRIDEPLLARCPRLKVVANIAVGYNNIDLAACTARGVLATNTPEVLTDTTADLAFTLMLATARRLTEVEAYIRAGQWQGWHLKQLLGVDVHHATLGIMGMGRIGRVIARRAQGFEMRVLYHDPVRLAADIEQRLKATYASKDELLAQADFVILQMPYMPQTHHLIGAAELKKMKPSAILINSTRGGIVDDAALVRALKDGTIRAAGLDTFEGEPKLDPEFLKLKNVVLAPHIGSSTEATRRAMAMTAAQNAVAALTGGTPPNLLNPEARSKE